MQLNGNKPATLGDLRRGEEAVISGLSLPDGVNQRLMELGFLPGAHVRAGRSAPGGDPLVFDVDGSQVALRRETAVHIAVNRQ